MAKVPSVNIFTKIATSARGQKIFKKMLDPQNQDWYNKTLPNIETTAATVAYVLATHVQKDIDKDSKTALQIQNILSWIASLALATPLNKGIQKFGDKVIKGLDPKNIPDVHKCINGIRVGAPIAMVIGINRFLLPTLFVPVSSKIRDFCKFYREIMDV